MHAEAELRRLARCCPAFRFMALGRAPSSSGICKVPLPVPPRVVRPNHCGQAAHEKMERGLLRATPVQCVLFDSLYVAEDHMTSLKEVRSVFDNPHGPAFVVSTPPWVLLTVVGQVTDLVDLTDMAVQAEVGTTSSELSGEWLWSQKEFLLGRAPMPPTQLLGGLAYESRVIKGLRYRSAPNVNSGVALLLFPDRLTSGDWLEVYDNESPPVLAQRLP
jgi:hypothetical protein